MCAQLSVAERRARGTEAAAAVPHQAHRGWEAAAALKPDDTRPLKLLDRRLTRNLGALDAAGGVFFAGQRRLTAIRDRDIIKMYRGIE